MFYKLIFNGNDKRKKISEETKTFEGLSSFAKKVFDITSNDIGFLYCGSNDVSAYEISCDEDLEYVLEIVNAFNKKMKFIDIKVIENFEMSPENPDRFSMAEESNIKKSEMKLVEDPVLQFEETEDVLETKEEVPEVKEEELKTDNEVVETNHEDVETNHEDVETDHKDISKKLEEMAEKIKKDVIESNEEDKAELLESRLSNILNETLHSIKKEIKKKPKKAKNDNKKQEKLLNRYNNMKEKTQTRMLENAKKIQDVYEKLNPEFKEKTVPFNISFNNSTNPSQEYENEVLMMENVRLNDQVEELTKKCIDNDIEMNSIKNSGLCSNKSTFETVHQNVVCDKCQKPNFEGRRFKCLVCHDFDLCESCESIGDHPHPMVRMVEKSENNWKLNCAFKKMKHIPFVQKMLKIELSEEEKNKMNLWKEKLKNQKCDKFGFWPFMKHMNKSKSPKSHEERKRRWKGRKGPFNMFSPFMWNNKKCPMFQNKNKFEVPEEIKKSIDQIGASIVKVFNPLEEKAPVLQKDEIIVEIPIKKQEPKKDFIMKKESKKEDFVVTEEPKKTAEELLKEKEEKIRNKKIDERKEYVKMLLSPHNIDDSILHFFVTSHLDLPPATFYQAIQNQKDNLLA